MSKITGKTIEYEHNGTRLLGYFCADDNSSGNHPGIVLVHDAFGVSENMKGIATRLAELGYAVLAADVWGDGMQLRDESQIGPTIGRVASDRGTWMGRLAAAHKTLSTHKSVDSSKIVFIGYCFGGASALEYLRQANGTIQGVVSFHAGLGLVGMDWTATPAGGNVLILTGFEDPSAKPEVLLELQNNMTKAGIVWETNIYSQTKHGFTRPDSDKANKPDVVAYNARSDRRSWAAMRRFLEEIFAV